MSTANYRRRKSEKYQENKRLTDVKSKSNQSTPQIQDFSISSTNIMPWKNQGIENKKAELVDLIAKEKPGILCNQETMLSKQKDFNLKNYIGLLNGHTNYQAHEVVAIFVHKKIPYQKITLNTSLQTTAATINVGTDVTVVSIYTSRSHALRGSLRFRPRFL